MPLDWNKLDLHLGNCGRVRCEPTWSLDEAWSKRLQDYDLWLVWAGRGRMWIDGQVHDIRPGFCLWMRPGHLYLAEQDAADRLGVNYVHFELTTKAGRHPDERRLPSLARHLPELTYHQGVTSRIAELSRGATSDRDVAVQLLRGVLMDLDRPAEVEGSRAGIELHHEQTARQAARLIREDPSRGWTVAALAEDAGYCVDHFSRVFQGVVGQSPRDFIVACRIERSQTLLRETALSVEQVARAMRYSSVFFFSRQFKSRVGVAPARWRAQALGK